MSYLALYRKYRSQTFSDLVGQDHVVRTIQNGIKLGKVAHSYLFTGPRGTGKTSTARLLAKALNCDRGTSPEPCNECDSCVAITEGHCMDVLEFDAASESGVDNVRDRIVNVTDYRPASCRYKIFIIDEVHDLSRQAFDALLKTIEEPPEHVIFILATTEYSKVPPTIRSRCQKYEFHRASLGDLIKRLEHVCESEGVKADSASLHAIARMADGGYRDALTLLEQVLITAEGDLNIDHTSVQLGLIGNDEIDKILLAMQSHQVGDLVAALDRIYTMGRDPRSILESLVMRVADLTRALYGVDQAASHEATLEAAMRELAGRLGPEFLSLVRKHAADGLRSVRDVTLPRLWLEAELVALALPLAQKAAKAEPAKPTTQAVVAAPSTPAPATRKAETPTAPAPTPKPKGKPREMTGDLALAHQFWSEVMERIGQQSRAAMGHLSLSAVTAVENNSVTIEFERRSDLDWILEKPKFMPLLTKEWDVTVGDRGWKLKMVEGKGDGRQLIDDNPVERPLEGERLEEVGRQIFEDI